jgi:hypothetical protein
MNKVKTCQFGSAQWFWPHIFPRDVEAGKNAKQNLHLLLIG